MTANHPGYFLRCKLRCIKCEHVETFLALHKITKSVSTVNEGSSLAYFRGLVAVHTLTLAVVYSLPLVSYFYHAWIHVFMSPHVR